VFITSTLKTQSFLTCYQTFLKHVTHVLHQVLYSLTVCHFVTTEQTVTETSVTVIELIKAF